MIAAIAPSRCIPLLLVLLTMFGNFYRFRLLQRLLPILLICACLFAQAAGWQHRVEHGAMHPGALSDRHDGLSVRLAVGDEDSRCGEENAHGHSCASLDAATLAFGMMPGAAARPAACAPRANTVAVTGARVGRIVHPFQSRAPPQA